MPRAVSSPLAVVSLVALAVSLAAVVAVGVPAPVPEEPTRASLSLSVDADADRLTLVHEGGDALSVEALTVRIRVGGEPVDHQPPVPFFAAEGFVSGPTGPFNPASDPGWTAGEVASLRLAGTNAPRIEDGDVVAVRVYENGVPVARLSVRA